MKPHHILIIDDQENIVSILRRELEKKLGSTCASATNSQDAFAKLKELPIELVICDVRLGEENGFQVLRQVKQNYPHIGLMMMTAYRSPAYRGQAEELGVAFFIEKPFAIAILVKAIERFFTQRATAESAKTADVRSISRKSTPIHFKLQDLIQLFCLNGRNMLIQAQVEGQSPVGKVYTREGRVLHAEWGDLTGEQAVFKMLALENLQLELQDHDEPVAETIQGSWEFLLLESARMNDEATEAEAEAAKAKEPRGPGTPTTPAPSDDPFADFWKSVDATTHPKLRAST